MTRTVTKTNSKPFCTLSESEKQRHASDDEINVKNVQIEAFRALQKAKRRFNINN